MKTNRQSVGTAQNCMAPCNDQIYDSRITMAAYPNLATLSKRDEICLVIQKLFKICHEWMDPVLGDELKIKKNVLLRKYPTLCDDLVRQPLFCVYGNILADTNRTRS